MQGRGSKEVEAGKEVKEVEADMEGAGARAMAT
jgi:hypothetical protein